MIDPNTAAVRTLFMGRLSPFGGLEKKQVWAYYVPFKSHLNTSNTFNVLLKVMEEATGEDSIHHLVSKVVRERQSLMKLLFAVSYRKHYSHQPKILIVREFICCMYVYVLMS